MSNDRIVKLVFIRIDSGNTGAPRKAVVPLVEGSDFAQFLGRVRRRLGLPDGTSLELLDAATGSVNSIERLIEVSTPHPDAMRCGSPESPRCALLFPDKMMGCCVCVCLCLSDRPSRLFRRWMRASPLT